MRLAEVMALAALFLYMTGCVSYRVGRQSSLVPVEQTDKYTLGVVEFDDQGWFRDESQAKAVIQAVRDAAAAGGTNIVIFVHGWHHSPRADDSNLQDFKHALERLHDEMELPIYRAARAQLLGSPNSRVVGVYVGWRGRSLPGLLDYLTFWDRKAAATRIGHGDVTELFTRIHDIYAKNNQIPKYTGLVTIGHSFGSQVAFAAISDVLKARVASAIPLDGGLEPATLVGGFGDLVVLVNPALEASAFSRISELTRNSRFDVQQTPVLLTISSESDGPNRVWFPIGRWFGVLGEPRGTSDQFNQKTHALGWYMPQITHCLTMAGGPPCKGFAAHQVAQRNGLQPALSEPTSKPARSLDSGRSIAYAGAWGKEDAVRPESIKLAADLGLAGTQFYPVDPTIDGNLPFIVAKATTQIMSDHNDVFNPNFVDFLVRYAGGTQLKRVALSMQSSVSQVDR